jgi:limonene-1,2-epoxide hydrolase
MADATTPTPIQVVEAFLDALQRQDVDAVLALTHDEVSYQNVPLPPAVGRTAFERQMRWFQDNLTGFEVVMHNIAADGPTVLTERTDVLVRGRLRSAFWVCGTFEVRDGKVAVWRDRFDYADVTVALVKGAVRALAASVRAARGTTA